MTDQTTPAEPHDYLAAMQAEYNAKPLTERLLDYFDESDMECLPPVILEALAKLADAEQARDEAIRVAGANAVAYDEARAETRRLGVSLAETIQERQQLRTRLADAEQTRRAALDVAADLTEDLAEARAETDRQRHEREKYTERWDALDLQRLAALELHALPFCETCNDHGPCETRRALDGDGVAAETETREQHLTALREAGRRLGESFQQLGEAIRDGAAKAHTEREAEPASDRDRADMDTARRDIQTILDGRLPMDTAAYSAAIVMTLWKTGWRPRHLSTSMDRCDIADGWWRLGQQWREKYEQAYAELADREQTAEQPDVDGWTIYPTTDGGLMVSHDTDADRPTLAADDSIPLAAALAFIADTEGDDTTK